MNDVFFVGSNPTSFPHSQILEQCGTRADIYNAAVTRAVTEYLWVVDPGVDVADFDFNWVPPDHQKTQLHSWLGVALIHRRSWLEQRPPAAQNYQDVNWDHPQRRPHCEIVVWDYGGPGVDEILARWPGATVLRYIGNHSSMMAKSQRAAGNKPFWVLANIVDYTAFNPDWRPNWATEAVLHVWASGDQKFGDTFWVPGGLALSDNLDDLPGTVWHTNGYPRRPWPVNYPTGIDLQTALRQHVWTTVMEYFVMPGSEWSPAPEPSLWKNRQITAFNRTGHVSLCPRDSIGRISPGVSSYPYIQYHNSNNNTQKPQDVVFISYDEENAEKNYQKLLDRVPNALRISGVRGNVAAYKAAAAISTTPWFYAVFPKLEIHPSFDFSYHPNYMDPPHHTVFYAHNPITDLTYGHGAVKLYHRQLTLDAADWNGDFTTHSPVTTVPILSAVIHAANAWEAWRTAYREAAKLSRLDTVESRYRLSQWLSVGHGPWGDASREGAAAGAAHSGDLNQVNDWAWLLELFQRSKSGAGYEFNLSV